MMMQDPKEMTMKDQVKKMLLQVKMKVLKKMMTIMTNQP